MRRLEMLICQEHQEPEPSSAPTEEEVDKVIKEIEKEQTERDDPVLPDNDGIGWPKPE